MTKEGLGIPPKTPVALLPPMELQVGMTTMAPTTTMEVQVEVKYLN